MHRTQLLLTDRQHAALKAWAKKTDRSLSEAVRLAVDRMLGGGRKTGRPPRLRDLYGLLEERGGPSANAAIDAQLYGEGR